MWPKMLLDHVDARVRSLRAVRSLYDALLPAMGYSRINADEDSVGYHTASESGAEPFVWLVQDPAHQPNRTRIAFAAATRADVDRLAAIARDNGAADFEPPALLPEYGPHYYAAFFTDAEGNKLEVCCRRPQT